MEAALRPWPALGALLLRDGLVTREELEAVLADQEDVPHQRISGSRLGEALVERGIVTPGQVAQLVAEQYTLPFMELTESEVGIRAAVLVPQELARRVSALPVSTLPDGSLLVAISDPPLALFSDELHAALGVPLRFAMATQEAVDAAITYAFERADQLFIPPPASALPERAENGTGEVDAIAVDSTDDDRAHATLERRLAQSQSWPTLGTLLIRDGVVTEEELDAALAQQRVSGGRRLGDILVGRGSVTRSDVTRLVAEQFELTFVDLDASEVETDVARLLPEELARRYTALPVSARDDEVVVALADPTRVLDAHALRAAFTTPVRFVGASPDAVDAAIAKVYAPADVAEEDEQLPTEDLAEEPQPEETMADDLLQATANVHRLDATDEAPVDDDVDLAVATAQESEAVEDAADVDEAEEPAEETEGTDEADQGAETEESVEASSDAAAETPEILGSVLALGASHVHLVPRDDGIRVRARVDGVLRDVATLTVEHAVALVAHLTEPGSDGEERRTPHEHTIAVPVGDHTVDARLVVVPTARGSKLTLTVHDPDTPQRTLSELGLQQTDEETLRTALAEPVGAVVVCGPSGSGRTTTFYAAVQELSTPERAVTTIEHPVEHLLPDADQVQVAPGTGLTFGRALRAVLRSDPDVVALGTIGDEETARLALRAAAGHLVLAIMDSQGAAAALRHLVDAGANRGSVSTVECVVSQRLVRRTCETCRETYYPDAEELTSLGRPSDEAGRRLLARGRGCDACGGTGFRGRVAVFEVLPVGDEIRALAESGASTTEIETAAVAGGMRTLADEGARLCLEGVTTAGEVRRVLGSRTSEQHSSH